MHYPRPNAFSNFKFVSSLIALTIICFEPGLVKAERSDVQWMRGGHADSVRSMDYSPDGQLFASLGDSYNTLKIWRLSDGLLLRTIPVFSSAGNDQIVIFLSDN